ncbi:hypothetical protein ABKV19_015893 [Rosa sericea]
MGSHFVSRIQSNSTFSILNPQSFPFIQILYALCELSSTLPTMASHQSGRALPKFGEWDVNDPASAEGFTIIFNKARADKKNGGSLLTAVESSSNYESRKENNTQKYPKRVCLHGY